MLRVRGDQVSVLQAFAGYYSSDAWLRFDEPLRIDDAHHKPVERQWRQHLRAQPRYRGVLGVQSDGDALATAIDAIAASSDRAAAASAFADLTGVCAPSSLPLMQTFIVRLNLCVL